ncbi:hypothetical protein L2E82_21165 [Cichorium intybus]|uniref:Uncharacterized protein n=1 Tax=Cichorium intybus TaxID=13427 RepID=A0ACB9DVD4_CICIN|nr:hypothetical protein L2E82_21165 [Cichorium intybus]
MVVDDSSSSPSFRELDDVFLQDIYISQIQTFCSDMDGLWRSVASKLQRDLWKRNLDNDTFHMEIVEILWSNTRQRMAIQSADVAHDDWKPLIMKLSNKEPEMLLSFLKANLQMIETRDALEYESVDLGLARAFTLPIKKYTYEILTLWYRAPEVLLGTTHYSTAVDICSVDCIFAELVTKMALFATDSDLQQLLHIFSLLLPSQARIWLAEVLHMRLDEQQNISDLLSDEELL